MSFQSGPSLAGVAAPRRALLFKQLGHGNDLSDALRTQADVAMLVCLIFFFAAFVASTCYCVRGCPWNNRRRAAAAARGWRTSSPSAFGPQRASSGGGDAPFSHFKGEPVSAPSRYRPSDGELMDYSREHDGAAQLG